MLSPTSGCFGYTESLPPHALACRYMRILDITVNKPVIGRWLNYGHFVFESAAQVQGLNVITYVSDIDQREDVLRMVMQPPELPQQVSGIDEDDGT